MTALCCVSLSPGSALTRGLQRAGAGTAPGSRLQPTLCTCSFSSLLLILSSAWPSAICFVALCCCFPVHRVALIYDVLVGTATCRGVSASARLCSQRLEGGLGTRTQVLGRLVGRCLPKASQQSRVFLKAAEEGMVTKIVSREPAGI